MHRVLSTIILIHTLTAFIGEPLSAFTAESPPHIPNGMVLTPYTTLRAADGELIISIGKQQRPVVPFQWRFMGAGIIEYVTVEQGIQYQFTVQQQDLLISGSSEPMRAGVLSVTAANITKNEQTAAVWMEWRHEPKRSLFGTHGFLLESDREAKTPTIPYSSPWDAKWTWFFYGNAFMRDDRMIYYLLPQENWKEESWVRRPMPIYKDLTHQSPLGTKLYTLQLSTSLEAGLEIWIPFYPLPLDRLNDFANVIHPGESRPADPQEPQRKTQ